MEVAGVVLGSFIILDIAEKASVVGRIISEIKSFPEDTAELLFQLANEAQKLEAWATEAALYTRTQDSSKQEVNDIQAAIGKALTTAVERILLALADARSITDRIGITKILTPNLSASTAAFSSLSLEPNRANTLHGAQARQVLIEKSLKSKTLRKRIGFSLKPWGSSDKEKLQDSVEKLKYWNGELWALLSRRQRLTLDFQVSCQILAVAADEPTALQTVQLAATGQSDLAASAGLAQANIVIGQGRTILPDSIAWRRLEWLDTKVHPRNQLAILKGSNPEANEGVAAFVNWLDYSSFSPDQKAIALERVGRLVELLNVTSKPSGLCTLTAYGFAKDDVRKRFGLVFEPPASAKGQAATDISFVSLSDLLAGKPVVGPGEEHKRSPAYARPTLPQRFAIARRLAIAFMELHNARWLHKGFNSNCVVFFGSGSAATSQGTIFDEPFVTGFEFSRPTGPQNISLPTSVAAGAELYQHPRLLSSSASSNTGEATAEATEIQKLVFEAGIPRFRPAFDMYSLGVVLLEIALWQPVKNLRRPNATPQTFAEHLRKVTQASVPHSMGNKYTKVVMICLGTEFRMPDQVESNEEDEQDSIMRELRRIYWEVVRPLEECHCR